MGVMKVLIAHAVRLQIPQKTRSALFLVCPLLVVALDMQ